MSQAITDNSQFKLSHTMIRVRDLEKSLDFYTRIMGMQVLRNTEYPEGRFTNVFIGYGPETEVTTIELTYNWDQPEAYEKGNGYGHLAIEVPNTVDAVEYLKTQGVTIKSPAKQMKHGKRMLAFILDPDEYVIELNESLYK